MKSITLCLLVVLFGVVLCNPPISIAFHWHLHQPIYYPYESVVDTIKNNRYSFSVADVFNSRAGPYNSWPVDAVQTANSASNLKHCGAQISLTGALQENLNNLANSSVSNQFNTWTNRWLQGLQMKTSQGNPAVALTAFGYHHPLMPLVPEQFFITTQIQLHNFALKKLFGLPYSLRGLFPPENAFSPRMIPALVSAGIQWVLVDNIHFDRAHQDYPFTSGSNLFPPNPSDQRNTETTNWVQLNDVWAPGKVSAPFGYRPYWVEYVDPATGASSRIVAVPGARYEGVEDGRGGFGALQYQQVMSQYAFANTDASRPILTVLAHDGDNYGGGTDSYYHSNFQNFVNWASGATSQFECTTIDDYLDRYPVPDTEVIHVEDGSWSGANNGDPLFLKWNPNFFAVGYEPERNSFAVLTAAMNRVLTAQSIKPYTSLDNILTGSGSATDLALHYFLCGQASDYEYWPTVQVWNSDPTVASNLAVKYADQVISSGSDQTPPTIFVPQRQYWNPGAVNWNPQRPDSSNFNISTLVYDVSGLKSVVLYVRSTPNQKAPTASNMIYSGGQWQALPMNKVPLTGPLGPQTDPLPTYIADIWIAPVLGYSQTLLDYYVSAVDTMGNTKNSPILHVWVDKKV